jgi:hypothetical protein
MQQGWWFLPKKKPLEQINGVQIEKLVAGLLRKKTEEGNSVHCGTFSLSTGASNLLPAIEQTRCASKLQFEKIRQPSSGPQYYYKFTTPVVITYGKRALERKNRKKKKGCIRLRMFEKEHNKPPRMVLLPYEAKIVPEIDAVDTGMFEDDEDMPEAELLRNIMDGLLNKIVRENPPKAQTRNKVYLNKNPENSRLYSFHSKKGRDLLTAQLASDQGLTADAVKDMSLFDLRLQIERFGGTPEENIKPKPGKKLKPKQEEKLRKGLVHQLLQILDSRGADFYDGLVQTRTIEIEEEIANAIVQIKFEVVGVYISSYNINGRWHLAFLLNSRQINGAFDSSYSVKSEAVVNTSEIVPDEAYDFFLSLLLEATSMKYHIENMIKTVGKKFLLLGWNKWIEVVYIERVVDLESGYFGRATACLSEFFKTRASRVPTLSTVTKKYPRRNFQYIHRMYNTLNSISKIHASQFRVGLESDFREHNIHPQFMKRDIEYRLGREVYLNEAETIRQLELAEIALPVVVAAKNNGGCLSSICSRRKAGSIAGYKTKNRITEAANKHLPGPCAIFVEKLYIGCAFLTWVLCNAWKLPFYCQGLWVGFTEKGNYRKTRRQIERVEKEEQRLLKTKEWGVAKRKEFAEKRLTKKANYKQSKYVFSSAK